MCLDEGFEDAMTTMVLPEYQRKYFRTTNHIERLNKELKRRSKLIGVFPNIASLQRLMGAVLLEIHEQRQKKGAMFTPTTYEAFFITDAPQNLKKIAVEQHKFRAA